MADRMLAELYMRVFQSKREAEALSMMGGETADRQRQVALAINKLLSDLIDIRTEQIKGGE